MNKTCKGCFAADTGSHPMSGDAKGCVLGYKTDGAGKPLVECPKPRTWKQLYKESKHN